MLTEQGLTQWKILIAFDKVRAAYVCGSMPSACPLLIWECAIKVVI